MRILVLLLATLLSGTAFAQKNIPVRFALDWRFEGPAAPYFVAIDKGYYKAEGLEVTVDPGSGSVEGINRVASGAYEIGSARQRNPCRCGRGPVCRPARGSAG